jgi:hypothetical protein
MLKKLNPRNWKFPEEEIHEGYSRRNGTEWYKRICLRCGCLVIDREELIKLHDEWHIYLKKHSHPHSHSNDRLA